MRLACTSHCCPNLQLQMQFSKPLPIGFSWVTSQKLAFSRLQSLTYSLPTILHWLATLTVQRKLTSIGGQEYRKVCGSSLLVETRVPSHAFKVLADNSHLGHWSPGFWCCSSWCQSLDLSTFQQHQHLPLPEMLCGRGTALFAGAAILKSECNKVWLYQLFQDILFHLHIF